MTTILSRSFCSDSDYRHQFVHCIRLTGCLSSRVYHTFCGAIAGSVKAIIIVMIVYIRLGFIIFSTFFFWSSQNWCTSPLPQIARAQFSDCSIHTSIMYLIVYKMYRMCPHVILYLNLIRYLIIWAAV